MKALLVRIGVDQAYGGWNAPVDPASRRFVYVPIPEADGMRFHPRLERRGQEFLPALKRFCAEHGRRSEADLRFPADLPDCPIHLDPDFNELTYGDVGARRGAGMRGMTRGDLLAFYAGLRPIAPCGHRLLYALIGLYVVDEVVPVTAVPRERWHQNAHTRRSQRGSSDIVVRAQRGRSGRLERCIPIGEWRGGAYRVTQELLDAWGGLSVKDGFIQRSVVPPTMLDPQRFYRWFLRHRIRLMDRNN
ncbi:MAG TPA: hypothetical protein VMV94_17385 [Phycisphaerae bacterium]|nr:hypothetical protein [Phycisphaerae bacterium]